MAGVILYRRGYAMTFISQTSQNPRNTQNRLNRLVNDQRVKFLAVGGLNTINGYVLFVLFEWLFGGTLGRFGYMVSLLLSYLIAMTIAFILHRKYVFKVKGQLLADFGRFTLVNLFGFSVNAFLLPVVIELTQVRHIYAQAVVAIIAAIASYFGHKYFSFRRKKHSNPATVAATP